MRNLPPPPVPSRLREMFKDYPELIEEIQEVLNKVVENGLNPRFDWAVTRLKDTMEAFYIDAAKVLKEAEKLGDPKAIAQAEQKCNLIDYASRAVRPWNDEGEGTLWDYFETYKSAFE